MGVRVTVRIRHGENEPVVILGNGTNACVRRGQQLVQDVRGCGHADPFSGVHSTLNENSRISLDRNVIGSRALSK